VYKMLYSALLGAGRAKPRRQSNQAAEKLSPRVMLQGSDRGAAFSGTSAETAKLGHRRVQEGTLVGLLASTSLEDILAGYGV
jgi:hypothetical protein